MTGPSISELLRRAARDAPERYAVIDGDRSLCYRDLESAVAGLAQYLQNEGARAGTIVSLEIPSSIDFVVASLAILRTGAVVSAINSRLGLAEQRSILDRVRPLLRLCNQTTAALANDSKALIRLIDDFRAAW